MPKIAIIGGTGLYDLEIKGAAREKVDTPFGPPSDDILVGKLEGVEAAFLARHGRGHGKLPAEINFRANAWALASIGIEKVISVSAVGSMKEQHGVGTIVFPDNFIDNTRKRDKTFYGNGVIGHISLARPVCSDIRNTLYKKSRELGLTASNGGTYICIEGPNFSTLAESLLYRSWGVDVIGMTNVPEVNLCREAGMCYATIACVTDYDCWHESEEAASIESIMDVLKKNVKNAMAILSAALPEIASGKSSCDCLGISKGALMTPSEAISEEAAARLAPLLKRLRGN